MPIANEPGFLNNPLESLRKARAAGAPFAKLAFIGLLMALLLIPMGMITGLIRERETNRTQAEKEVSQKWGEAQKLTGPILTVPYRIYTTGENGKVDTATAFAHFLPDDMDIRGRLHPEIRHRGIFDIPLFKADLELEGRFSQPDFSAWKVAPGDVLWEESFLTLAVKDVRSLADALPLQWGGEGREFAPEYRVGTPVSQGLHTQVSLRPQAPGPSGYSFKFQLRLNGSQQMHFLPMGKQTRVFLQSDWKSPSFSGAFLPEANSVDEKGFQARWKTLYLSRDFPQSWVGTTVSDQDWDDYAFGVDLRLPVDRYQKTTRCAKYAALFILLTFVVFFVFETFDRARIHPLQYLLVGFALCLFYLLLLAMTEHIPFNAAYAAATVGTVALITAYGAAILSLKKRAFALGAMLAALYAYLFTLLQMEDYALLMGAAGLFAILATVMYLTRRINWYGKPEAEAAA